MCVLEQIGDNVKNATMNLVRIVFINLFEFL